jgi:hypothetical protein
VARRGELLTVLHATAPESVAQLVEVPLGDGGPDEGEDEASARIAFYACCSAIEDLAFAGETNDDRYGRAALRSLRHLFGDAGRR